MSLKAFHIFFVTVSTLFLAGFCIWAGREYFTVGGSLNLLYAVLGLAGTIAAPIYGVWFLKKTKGVGLV